MTSEITCKFIPNINDPGKFICERCGAKTKYANAERMCDAGPSVLKRLVNFVSAATQHAILGNPTVSPEVLSKRLEICKSCELFKPNTNDVGGICTHNSCGCNVKDNVQYFNKLAWADQECPLKKWLKESKTND